MLPFDTAPARLSDHDLLVAVVRLAASEREATAALVALLAEVDTRRLYLGEGCSSLFTYCTERLHLSEHAAYHRIEAARAVREFPGILERLKSGALTLTTVTLLRPHLTAENCVRLLDLAVGRSKRDVELLVRRIAPLPDVSSSLRRLRAAGGLAGVALATTSACAGATAAEARRPLRDDGAGDRLPIAGQSDAVASGPATGPTARAARDDTVVQERLQTPGPAARPQPAEVRVLSAASYSLRVTLSAEAYARLRRAQDLLRHVVPDGDPAAVVDRALALLVEQLERKKFAATKATSRSSVTREAPDMADTATPVPRQEAVWSGTGRRRRRRSSRHIPAAVKRGVWDRDQGRCAFMGTGGRCGATGMLEFHHRVPYVDGGAATADNLELRCRPHHADESRRWFGEDDGRLAGPSGGRPPSASSGTRSGPS